MLRILNRNKNLKQFLKRFYNTEEETPKPIIERPKYHPAVIPRRRHGLTVESFLEKIGKNCVEYKDKFECWEDLFTMKTEIMRLKEIPLIQRKWILKWVQKYRQGETPGVTCKNGDVSTKKFNLKKFKAKTLRKSEQRALELKKAASSQKAKPKSKPKDK